MEPKGLLAGALTAVAVVSFGDVFESPAAVEKTEKGWSFRFAPRGEEKVNFVSIGTVEGEIGKWSVKADGWEFARGEGMKSGFATHFPHEHLMTMLEIEVEAAKRPVLNGVEAKMVPYADVVDPKLFKLTQLDANTVFADFGRDIAIAGVSYPENLGKLDVWASWSPDFAAPGDEAGRIYGRTLAKDGATVNEFNAIHRGDSRYVVRSDKPIDAKKLVFDVKPYGYMKHITSETWEQKLQRLAWWQEARFGLFIHFGLYATPARQEWVKTLEQIPESKYDEFFNSFNPDRFDAKAWAKAAKAAGMKYAVLTTRHHEGFSLFDTKFSDYKITNTPFKRDLVKEFVDAFRAEGLKVGFYYSLLDWHHPDYPIDDVHPLRKGNLNGYENGRSGAYDEVNKTRDMAKYRAFMKNQITELLTNYGKIDIIWYDFSYPNWGGGKGRLDWDSEGIIRLTKKLQPEIIIDNRLDLPDYEDGWDFATPEQNRSASTPTFAGREWPWETCQTFSGSWGYARDEKSWKSAFQCIEQLVYTVSKGGNVIMNVGPTAAGEFDYRALERLADYGRWLHANGDSIYGCTKAPPEFVAPNGTHLTYNPRTRKLYMHMLSWPFGNVRIGFGDKVAYARLLNDKSEVKVEYGNVWLPVDKPPFEIPVIEFTLK